MQPQVVWHGTQRDVVDLAHALAHNCACERDPDGSVRTTCAAHHIIHEQRTLNGLLFARYLARRIQAQEFADGPVAAPDSAGPADR